MLHCSLRHGADFVIPVTVTEFVLGRCILHIWFNAGNSIRCAKMLTFLGHTFREGEGKQGKHTVCMYMYICSRKWQKNWERPNELSVFSWKVSDAQAQVRRSILVWVTVFPFAQNVRCRRAVDQYWIYTGTGQPCGAVWFVTSVVGKSAGMHLTLHAAIHVNLQTEGGMFITQWDQRAGFSSRAGTCDSVRWHQT